MSKIIPPEKGAKDVAHGIAKGILGMVPITGPLVAEIFELVLEPSYNKRLQDWLNKVSDALVDLQDKVDGFSISSLVDNEEFVSTFIRVSQISQRTHIEEKRLILVSAIKNSITQLLEYDIKQIFIGLLESLTIRHIKILREIFESQKIDNKYDEHELKNHLKRSYFDEDHNLMELFLSGLSNYHLLSYYETDVIKDNRRIWTLQVSNIGIDFLKFVE